MMSAQTQNHVTVTCVDHSKYVSIALRNLFDSKRGTDFDVCWDGKSARAHRTILELFLTPESIGIDQNEQHVLFQVKQEVPDNDNGSDNNILHSLLEFLYKGEVTVPEEQMEGLLGAARDLDFQMLVDSIVHSCGSKVIDVGRAVHMKAECPIDYSENTDLVGETGRLSESADGLSPNRIRMEPCYENQCSSASNPCMSAGRIGMEELSEQSYILPGNISNLQLGFLSESQGLAHSEPDPGYSNPKQPYLNAVKLESGAASLVEHCTAEFSDPMMSQYDGEGVSGDESVEPGTSEGPSNFEVARGGATKLYKCSHCKFETQKYKIHRNHLLKLHNLTPRGEPAPMHKCPYCEFDTAIYAKYYKHLLDVHEQTVSEKPVATYKCQHCEFETCVQSSYYGHILSFHGLTASGEPAKKHVCPECDYSTVVLSRLSRHQQTMHSKDRNFACPHCTYAGKQLLNLKRHLNVVHGEGDSRFTCKICGRRCTSQAELSRHTRIHSNERPYKCPQCNYASKLKNSLKRHLLNIH